jgi:hypothetical protein
MEVNKAVFLEGAHSSSRVLRVHAKVVMDYAERIAPSA